MDAFLLEPTKSTPLVRLDPLTGSIQLKGESFPENPAKFFAPVFSWVKEYLARGDATEIVADVEMTYFNSSSSKALMNLFELLEQAAETGKKVTVNWIYHQENETAQEAGEEFREDVPSLTFNLVQSAEE